MSKHRSVAGRFVSALDGRRSRSRASAALLAAIVATTGLLSASPPAVLAATFTVTTTADAGPGSLRQAIGDANLTAAADTITFAITGLGPYVIQPATILPPIGEPLTIDATSAALPGGAPGVVLDGTSAGAGHGLTLTAGATGSTIRGLRIVRFAQYGIFLNGPSGVVIEGNHIGTDGTADQGNGKNGIVLQGAAGTVIRGNLISGNGLAPDVEPCCASGFGIWLADSGASGTTIAGNLIGTNASGTAAIGNGNYAITISSSNNTIGGTSAADRNVISVPRPKTASFPRRRE